MGVHEVQLLAGELGDPVDVDRVGRMGLVDELVTARPYTCRVEVCTTRADGHTRRTVSRNAAWLVAFSSRSLLRVAHRGHVAHLTGQVEHRVDALEQRRHRRIGDGRHEQPIDLDIVEMVGPPAVLGHERVDDPHGHPGAGERCVRGCCR